MNVAPSRRKRLTANVVATQALLALYSLVILFPLIWMSYTALKSSTEIFQGVWSLPETLHWENFANAWGGDGQLGRYFGNSALVVVVSLGLILSLGAMASYALTRFRFRGAQLLLNGFISGMMFPIFLGIVPLFLLMSQWGLSDTFHGLILAYVAYSLPFTIFVLAGFFRSLPEELAEASMLDGCGRFGTFWRVMMPLAKPGLAVAAVFNFIGLWNEYPLALVLMTEPSRRTLPVGIAAMAMRQQYGADWGALFAGLVIVMIPTIVVYIFFQRHISSGLTAGALKG